MSATERIGFVLKILGADQISPNASASLLEIGHSISTWPQLGSSVVAGGAVVTDAVRRILLNSFTDSGRYSVDVESIVGNGLGEFRSISECKPSDFVAHDLTIPEKPTQKALGTLTEEEFRWLVTNASLAPSGGNSQPWRFLRDEDGTLLGFLDTERRSPILDFNFTASLLALGAAAEIIMLAAPLFLTLLAERHQMADANSSNPAALSCGSLGYSLLTRRFSRSLVRDGTVWFGSEKPKLPQGKPVGFFERSDR